MKRMNKEITTERNCRKRVEKGTVIDFGRQGEWEESERAQYIQKNRIEEGRERAARDRKPERLGEVEGE